MTSVDQLNWCDNSHTAMLFAHSKLLNVTMKVIRLKAPKRQKKKKVREKEKWSLIGVKQKQWITQSFNLEETTQHSSSCTDASLPLLPKLNMCFNYNYRGNLYLCLPLGSHPVLLLLRSLTTCSKTGSVWLSYLQAYPEQVSIYGQRVD